jgi:hypothetical protein
MVMVASGEDDGKIKTALCPVGVAFNFLDIRASILFDLYCTHSECACYRHVLIML